MTSGQPRMLALALLSAAVAAIACAAPTARSSPTDGAPTAPRRPDEFADVLPHAVHRQAAGGRRSPLAAYVASVAAAAAPPALRPSNLLPHGVIYDPVAGFMRERIHVRDVPGGPTRVLDGSIDIRSALRTMKVHVPGDALHDSMPVLSHQVDMSDVAAVRQDTTTATVSGSKSNYKLVLDSNMPEEPRVAFEAAIKTWSETFPSSVEIRIRFSWSELDGDTLGATAIPFYIRGSTDGADKLDDSTVYGAALASAIEGKDFVPESEFHVVMGFNKAVKWHFDGNTDAPFHKWDLQSTALHEVGHGLFFAGIMVASPRQELAEFSFRNDVPGRFDRFLATEKQVGLATCVKPADIYRTITSSALRFVDPSAPDTINFGLFSPPAYLPGSTTYHQDPDQVDADCKALAIPDEECSDLMTQSLPNGYTQRVVGTPVTRMMESMLSQGVGYMSAKPCAL